MYNALPMIRQKLFGLFDRVMGSQWACPHGPLGRLAGMLMERGNADMNALAIDALEIEPGDAVLEIGFGPGLALEHVAEKVRDHGSVAGIDPSALMVRQASRRLRRHVEMGRADVQQGYASNMPWGEETFDRTLSVNTIYFWPGPQVDLREIRRVLKRGGRFALIFRAAEGEGGVLEVHGTPERTTVAQVVGWMEAAGFVNVFERARAAPFGPQQVTAVALVGTAKDPSLPRGY